MRLKEIQVLTFGVLALRHNELNTSKVVKNNSAAPHFCNPLLSVSKLDEKLFLVYYILLHQTWRSVFHKNFKHQEVV